MPETVNKSVLAHVKYEYKNRNSLFPKSYPIIIDIDAAKMIFDHTYFTDKLDGLKGFIQEIYYNPFGLVLMSEIQVNY